MKGNISVFERVEQKYILSKSKKDKLLNRISDNLEKDEYFESKICNIYFDNEDNELTINSLEKPEFKTKVRLRSYDVPNSESNVFLEIKDKFEGIVGKRRIKLNLKEFNDYIEKGEMKDTQIMRELDYYFKYFNLKPKIYVGYDRQSYYYKDDEGLRITFDSNLKSRDYDLKLDLGRDGKNYFDNDTYIMEVKVCGSMPLWLVRSLNEEEIYPVSFSKIGSIYSKERGSDVMC